MTFSFLITSPIINEYVVVIMLGFFGWKITVLYVLSGMLIGITAGFLLGRMPLHQYIVEDMAVDDSEVREVSYPSFKARISFGIGEAISIVRRIWLWIFIGVGIGAVIHNYIPDEVIRFIISKTGMFSVPLATILGVPMYGSCVATVPVAVVLFNKGISLGTALAFMMATVALSLPKAIMLRWAMHLKLILIFFGVTTVAIIITRYYFNFWQTFLM